MLQMIDEGATKTAVAGIDDGDIELPPLLDFLLCDYALVAADERGVVNQDGDGDEGVGEGLA